MDIAIRRHEGLTIFDVSGRIDSATAPLLEEGLLQQMEAGHLRFLLDMGRLEFMGSSGLRVLVSVQKALRARNGGLVIARPTEPLRAVLHLSGASVQALLPVYETAEAALSALASGERPNAGA